MLQFGFTSTLDVLSWIVVLALGAKTMATVIVLLVNKHARDQPGWGSILWWVTKLAPLVMVPCLVWIAALENNMRLVQIFLAFGLFVVVAVPLSILTREKRLAERPTGGLDLRPPPIG